MKSSIAAIATTLLLVAYFADAEGYCWSCKEGLFSNDRNTLSRGESLVVDDLSFQMQWDSNLVLYKAGVPKWASMSQNSGGTYVVLQPDGNFVMYKDDGTPVWASDTRGAGPGPYCLKLLRTDIPLYYGAFILPSNCKWEWKRPPLMSDGRIANGSSHGYLLSNDTTFDVANRTVVMN
ncbi:Aste57867_526 [Aphanomyces stellatus]|uniref:Aste57867_526 protein n=1 Tax=Aphanomyces stellatus TaxID=120398 RepID=A0A485K815_9STRA|nr:hypothetical protein As57867_000525 [Aphanomyces stellatus]VFT77751.1 Aste57867_526 [Aphanomyces stellatus]